MCYECGLITSNNEHAKISSTNYFIYINIYHHFDIWKLHLENWFFLINLIAWNLAWSSFKIEMLLSETHWLFCSWSDQLERNSMKLQHMVVVFAELFELKFFALDILFRLMIYWILRLRWLHHLDPKCIALNWLNLDFTSKPSALCRLCSKWQLIGLAVRNLFLLPVSRMHLHSLSYYLEKKTDYLSYIWLSISFLHQLKSYPWKTQTHFLGFFSSPSQFLSLSLFTF